MTQARKTLELRIKFLVDAMSECHMAVATRKRWKEIEASMDAVEIAWDRIRRTSPEFVSYAGLNLDHLPMMVEMVLTKAEKYLAKAEKYAEAQMGPERWAKAVKYREAQVQALEVTEVALEVSAVDEVNKVAPEVSAVDEVNKVAPEVSAVDKVNKVALEVSAVDEVNKVALEVSAVDEVTKVAPEVSAVDEVNKVAPEVSAVDEVNKVAPVVSAVDEVNKVAPEVSAENKVNEESSICIGMNEDSGKVCGAKEEMSKGKSLEIEAKVEVNEKSEEVVTAKLPDVLQRFDFTAKVQVEEFGMKVVKNSEEVKKSQEDKEVEILPLMKEVKESRHANWDPGELVDAKAQVEMLDAKEAEILLNIDKVGLQLFMKEVWSSGGVIKKALLIVMLLLKERFVNNFTPLSVIELSDYG